MSTPTTPCGWTGSQINMSTPTTPCGWTGSRMKWPEHGRFSHHPASNGCMPSMEDRERSPTSKRLHIWGSRRIILNWPTMSFFLVFGPTHRLWTVVLISNFRPEAEAHPACQLFSILWKLHSLDYRLFLKSTLSVQWCTTVKIFDIKSAEICNWH